MVGFFYCSLGMIWVIIEIKLFKWKFECMIDLVEWVEVGIGVLKNGLNFFLE